MNRQEAFDTAAKHLLTTRKPSGNANAYGGFACTYSGSGCALRPFIPKDADIDLWDEIGSLSDFPKNEIEGAELPDFIKDDMDFFESLQLVHDNAAVDTQGDPIAWLEEWKSKMFGLAEEYDLNTEVLLEQDPVSHS